MALIRLLTAGILAVWCLFPLVSVVCLTQPSPPSASSSKKKVTIVGAGWGGLSASQSLLNEQQRHNLEVILLDAAPRVGGLVRDGYRTSKEGYKAEAGQHGFWNNYHNIYAHLYELFGEKNLTNNILTDYAEQGQYSPRGLEAVWPVYKDQWPPLPTGLAQLAYTNFMSLPLLDRASALPLVLAFSEFDDSPSAWERYDSISFQDLCIKLGVSERCYKEAFEPMILTGLFAPGRECSAAAALGMAYFFVLQSQNAFDVQWCRGNIGSTILQPWIDRMIQQGLTYESSTKLVGVQVENDKLTSLLCEKDGTTFEMETDVVIFALGASALSRLVSTCPQLAQRPDFRKFANLRGTSVLATRLYLDRNVTNIYSANACWGFDKDIGMTMFDIRTLHGNDADTVRNCPGAVLEVDYYYANELLALSDDDIIAKVKSDLDNLLGTQCEQAEVVDAAIVRLPNAVNWYFPGSYRMRPGLKAETLDNVYFCGDLVKAPHSSWSQEKAFVTGKQVVNQLLGRGLNQGVIPVGDDELHVKLGKDIVSAARTLLGGGDASKGPSLADFFW